jgi:hypothetical protein
LTIDVAGIGGRSKIRELGIGMNRLEKIMRVAAATIIVLTVAEVAAVDIPEIKFNPNKLQPCPKADLSKKTEWERVAKWLNCWGRYQVALTKKFKGDVFEGEWAAGMPNGKGTYYYLANNQHKGTKYVGDFNNGSRDGQGAYFYADGSRYVGEWRNDQKHGLGTYTDAEGGTYVGQFKEDNRNGEGTYIASNGDKYIGEFKFEKYHGQGTFTATNGGTYVGEFQFGKYHGVGTHTLGNGSVYVGEFKEGKYQGQGVFYYLADDQFKGDKYVGEFRDGKYHGQGTYYYLADNQFKGDKYVGEFRDGKYNGQGVATKADGRRLEGIWESDKFIRETKVTTPVQQNEIVTNLDRLDINLERRQLAEERGRMNEEKRQREKPHQIHLVKLQVTHTQPSAEGDFIINANTNTDTASLKINGEEQGGRADGKYLVKKVARAGVDTQFTIVATDINGNTDTKTITVIRRITESKSLVVALNPAQMKRQPERDAVAIIIGIADYKNLPRADYANDDARVFYDYAIRALGVKPENIKLLVDTDADDVAIYQAFKTWLPSRVRAGTDVYVYFSGHGLPTADGKGLYLLPQRAHRDFIDKTAITQAEINAAIQVAKPRSVTVFLDSCYSGQARSGETLIASARPVALKTAKQLFPENFTVITASQADQISSSSPDLKHGIFSYYLMRGMEGDADVNRDGRITAGEMQAYLAENVSRQAGMQNRVQQPQLIGDVNRVLVGR